jgi:hypothetical protein
MIVYRKRGLKWFRPFKLQWTWSDGTVCSTTIRCCRSLSIHRPFLAVLLILGLLGIFTL